MYEIRPLISVVTVCYNAVNNIERTIQSITNQAYSNIEYIIIDGGSTDGTIDIIKKYVDKITYWVSEPDKGIYDAMNKGIKVATGEWINFMNCGDFFVNSNIFDLLFREKEYCVDVIYGDTKCMFPWGDVIKSPLSWDAWSRALLFYHQSSFVRLSLMKSYLFDIKYHIAADYDFFYKIRKQYNKFYYIPIVIAAYDLVGCSLSEQSRCLLYKEKMRIRSSDSTISILAYYLFLIKQKTIDLVKKFISKRVYIKIAKIKMICNSHVKAIYIKI